MAFDTPAEAAEELRLDGEHAKGWYEAFRNSLEEALVSSGLKNTEASNIQRELTKNGFAGILKSGRDKLASELLSHAEQVEDLLDTVIDKALEETDQSLSKILTERVHAYFEIGSREVRRQCEVLGTPSQRVLQFLACEEPSEATDSEKQRVEGARHEARKGLGPDQHAKESVVQQLLSGRRTFDLPDAFADGVPGRVLWRGPYKDDATRAISMEALRWRETYLEKVTENLTPNCGRLFILSGPPTSGKTMLLNMVRESPELRPAIVPKFATRRWRGLKDDTQFAPEISDADFEFVYPYHLNRYGIKASDISDILATGGNAFVVVSPPRVVKSLQRFFGPLAVSVYLHSNRAEVQLEEIVAHRAASSGGLSDSAALEEEVRKRIINMRVMRRQYVDNIALYDHVLLNISTPEDLSKQLEAIVQSYEKVPGSAKKGARGSTAIFLLCAPPSSGKGTLSEALRLMGTDYISNVTKVADRAPRENDGSEIKALGEWVGEEGARERRGLISEETHNITYLFNDTRYGVSTQEMWDAIAEGTSQLLITNMQAIPRFKTVFGPLVVPVYLYTTRTPRQIREYLLDIKRLTPRQADRRLAKAAAVFRDYVKHIAWFDHVLLNTGDVDDLIDQMFNLLASYSEAA